MKILFHILLDMNQKTKISTKFPRSKLGVATAVFSLGGVAVYSLGVINPLQASQSEYLQVDGVQNSVQYLTSLVIDSPTAKVEFKYDDASKAVRASGSLNMQNLVVGQGNESSASSVVFWWTENNNQWANSVIVWGNNTTNEGNNNVIILSPGSKSSSENTAILNGQNVVTNGKNITVVNGGNLDVREKSKVSGNYVTVFGDSLVAADHVVVFGDKVKNNKSNTFVFNGQDTEFVPEQESAFYANSKVAINGDYANATLDVHGGMMIGKRGDYSVPRDWDSSGIISLFSRENKTGLCGYDGKAKRRVPLSESARKSWLCAPMWDIWNLPANAVSNNPQRSFPQVWNQNKDRHWDWESPKWIYGSKKEPQHFLCADGYVPDVADPIGKTGVKCIPCEWAKSGDLNCTTQKADNSAATPHCPQGTNYNETSKKCEGTKSTPCVAWDNIVSFNPDTQIETYNADTWIWDITQKCEAKKCQEGYILEDGSCKPTPIGSCIGEIPNGGKVNPNASKPTSINTKRVAVEAESTLPCSYLCADGFIIGNDQSGEKACLKCKSWTWNPTDRTCIAELICPTGTVYGKGPSGDGCYYKGNCLVWGEIYNYDYSRVREVYNKPFRPLGRNLEWTYVKGEPKERSCQYTCPDGYENHPEYKSCYKIGCSSSSNDESVTKFYQNTTRAYGEGNPRRPSEFVSQQELKQKRDRKEEGCFYTCDKENQYIDLFGKTICLTTEHKEQKEKEKKGNSCAKYKSEFYDYDSYIEYYENPSKKDEAFTLVEDNVFSNKKTSKAQWCFATCKQWYNLVKRSEKSSWCVPSKCEKDEYWYETSKSYGFCSSCPTGKIWNTRGPKTPNNIPKECVNACADGLTRSDGKCVSLNRQKEQCVWEWLHYDSDSGLCKGCLIGETFDKTTWKCK